MEHREMPLEMIAGLAQRPVTDQELVLILPAGDFRPNGEGHSGIMCATPRRGDN